MDMISDLPEFILHDIMSRLPHEDSARTIVLSKSWRQTWSTFPILVFVLDESWYYDKHLNKGDFMTRNSFYKFVDNFLLRFHNQCLTIKQLKLCMYLNEEIHSSLYPRIDYWMELARECRVEVLNITILHFTAERYHVPSSVLEAKSLVKLRLNGRISLDQAFLNHPIKFSSLKVLALSSVRFVDKQVFQNLLTSCPLIKYLTLDRCYGIDSVCIHGLSKLKGVKLVGFIMEVEIDAPSLQNFHYNSATGIEMALLETSIKMDKCINLKKLSLTGWNITHRWFLQHSHLFITLRILELKFCTMPRWVNMSCSQLVAIKLCSYIYHDAYNKLPIISFLNGSRQLEISFTLYICGALDYCKLRTFFLELPCTNVLATLSIYHIRQDVETDVLQDFSVPPPVIKHLHLHASFEIVIYFPLVASLLWSCRPSIISCGLSNRTIIKVLCEALMSGKKGECFCSSRHIKCWWHDLKDVKVTYSSSDGNENSVDCKTFLDVLPTLTEGNVSFRLE